jgi:hypothetical protein
MPSLFDTLLANLRVAPSVVAITLYCATSIANAAQVVVPGPTGSGSFGANVTVLPNGNIVVVDTSFDFTSTIPDVGAVYLYRPNGLRISTLRGSTPNDRVGSNGVQVLADGRFIVLSPEWDRNTTADVGAISICDADLGCDGAVSTQNSLIGSQTSDNLGSVGVLVLANGDYVVRAPSWDRGSIVNAGAVAHCDRLSPCRGFLSAAGSLTGGSPEDQVGDLVLPFLSGGYAVLAARWDRAGVVDAGALTVVPEGQSRIGQITAQNSLIGVHERDFDGMQVLELGTGRLLVTAPLWDNGVHVDAGAALLVNPVVGVAGEISDQNALVGSSDGDSIGQDAIDLRNGNFVVGSQNWDNGAAANAGAAVFGSGIDGVTGPVSAAIGLVGDKSEDRVGANVIALTNGDYVVRSESWGNGAVAAAGAATFGSGTSGVRGVVSPSNSLVGSSANDQVGASIVALSNGGYVIASPQWSNGATALVGAVTYGAAGSAVVGPVSAANSLIGSTAGDLVGSRVLALSNGNYVVLSRRWDRGAIANAGAATFALGIGGIIGTVSEQNSLVGSATEHSVGESGQALANGNYVVQSPGWDNGSAIDAGAATFGSGVQGIVGPVSAANSLVGSRANDRVGDRVRPLRNGNYVVQSPLWDNGAAVDAGAATFGTGSMGVSGVVSAANSLVGLSAGDRIGDVLGIDLAGDSSDYLVSASGWNSGNLLDAGAVALGDGATGVRGVVSPLNSIIGARPNDRVGSGGANLVGNGHYLVRSPNWDDGALADAGVFTLGLVDGSSNGIPVAGNSVFGTIANQGVGWSSRYDSARKQLVVGQPADNRVVLHRPGNATSIVITAQNPQPSFAGQRVTFTAVVDSSPTAPAPGAVTFRLDGGGQCTDNLAPIPIPPITTVVYSCAVTITTVGETLVYAEYVGNGNASAYSGSVPVTHLTLESRIFSDGFESPSS